MADGRADNDLNKKATVRSIGFPVQKVFQQRASYPITGFGHVASHYGIDPPAPVQVPMKEGPSKLQGFPSGYIGRKRDQGGTTGLVANLLRGNLKIDKGIDDNQNRATGSKVGGTVPMIGSSVNPTRNRGNPASPLGGLVVQIPNAQSPSQYNATVLRTKVRKIGR